MDDYKYKICAVTWNNEKIDVSNCSEEEIKTLLIDFVNLSFALHKGRYKKLVIKKKVRKDNVYQQKYKDIVEFYETGYHLVTRPQVVDIENKLANDLAIQVFSFNKEIMSE